MKKNLYELKTSLEFQAHVFVRENIKMKNFNTFQFSFLRK